MAGRKRRVVAQARGGGQEGRRPLAGGPLALAQSGTADCGPKDVPDHARARPVREIPRMDGGGRAIGAERPERHDRGDRDGGRRARRRASCCSRASTGGFRAARLRLLHQPREPQGRRARGQSAGRAAVPLEVAAAGRSASRAASSRPATPRPTPTSRRGARISRLGAWASDQSRPLACPRRAGAPARRIRGALSGRRDPAPAALGRLSRAAGLFRVLAEHAVPPARPHHLHAHRAAPTGAGRSENCFRDHPGRAGGGLGVSPRAGGDASRSRRISRWCSSAATRSGSSRRRCGCRFSISPRSMPAAASRCASSR